VDVKEKRKEKKKGKEKRKEKKRYSESVCVVCICFIFYIYIFYDEIAKIKEEFNILIGSRSRIINLYVSCISNIR
jgi:hypothetical protein